MDRIWETQHRPDGRLPLHRHRRAYAALILEGRYDEVSADGRFSCEPGMVVLHPPHHAHANAFGSQGARVLNVSPGEWIGGADAYRVGTLPDPGAIETLVRRNPQAAVRVVVEEQRPVAPRPPAPWLAGMAQHLREACGQAWPITRLAVEAGVTPAHAARTFKKQFGVTPSTYRREFRLRLGLMLLRSGYRPAAAASLAGFSDQSHFGRELKRMTGLTPGRWLAKQADEPEPAEVNSVLDGCVCWRDPLA